MAPAPAPFDVGTGGPTLPGGRSRLQALASVLCTAGTRGTGGVLDGAAPDCSTLPAHAATSATLNAIGSTVDLSRRCDPTLCAILCRRKPTPTREQGPCPMPSDCASFRLCGPWFSACVAGVVGKLRRWRLVARRARSRSLSPMNDPRLTQRIRRCRGSRGRHDVLVRSAGWSAFACRWIAGLRSARRQRRRVPRKVARSRGCRGGLHRGRLRNRFGQRTPRLVVRRRRYR